MRIEAGRPVQVRTKDGAVCFNARVADGSGASYRLHSDADAGNIKGQRVLLCQGNAETMALVREARGKELLVEITDDLYDEERRSFFRVDDAFPVKIRRVGAAAVKGSCPALVYPSSLGTGEPLTSLQDSALVTLLEDINNKLDFLLNALVMKEAGVLNEEARAVNISASGIRFEIDEEFSPGDVVELRMLLPSHPPRTVVTVGEVTRVNVLERGDSRVYDTAIEFVEMSDEVREEIIRYTLRRQRETIRKQRKDG
ncbi:MAG: PilZ domain-containing protein [Nitrospirae bacterium]|nr:PilZ domain-containing protein [Nitrospirota bacterium]